ncbi:MAG: hypothetical protein ACREIA_20965, partial [Opitutaceae bacterium]
GKPPDMPDAKKTGLTGFAGKPPRRVSLRITVDVETREAAERIARDYARRGLESVLAAFVGDLAVAATRPGSWEHERVSAWLSSHVWECEPADDQPRLRDDEVMGSAYGAYPWDGWEKYAVAHGVAAELAALGRLVIREAWQHAWDERLRSLCGWRDDGRRMLRLARRNPALAEKRWTRLLDTDGGRYDPETGRVL